MAPTCRQASRLRAAALGAVLAVGLATAAPPAVAQVDADHLIISEVVTTVQRVGARFIEIVNPTAVDAPLQDVHLTNGTFRPNEAGYWRLVETGAAGAVAGGGVGGAFHGRFPDGYVLAAGDSLVVAVNGSAAFEAAYGHLPDFEIFEDGASPDAVPELVEVFPGSIGANVPAEGGNAVTLGSVAGSLALYRWDGASALVGDLDYVHWGTNQSYRVDKTGYASYLDDTPVANQTPLPGSAGDGRSYTRASASEGTESTPGNGATGHDETSENLGATFSVVTPQTPATAPAAWHPSAPIFVAASQVPSAPYAGQATTVTVTVVANPSVAGVDVSYTVDGGAVQTLAATAAADDWQAVIPAQAEGAEVRWWATATTAAGGAAVHPAAAPRYVESWITAAEPVAGEGPDKLLLTEICTLGTDQEFVEIWNPNAFDVDLSDYYLTDAIYSPNNTGYWNIGGGVLNADTIGGGAFTDFHARFPDGYTIAAGDTIVVTIPGSASFAASFGFLPDLELYEDDQVPDQVPDMRWVFGSEGNNSIVSPESTPSLTNTGEPVILYHFAQGDDLVTDIDIFVWQAGTTSSYLFSKTGITIGGSAYAPDTAVGAQQPYPTQLAFGDSYVRVDADEGTQTPTGSNGVEGRDELSENWPTTFTMATSDPSRPSVPEGGASLALIVPPKTFLPSWGEEFPIQFTGQANSEVRVRIFDQNGRLVATLFDSRFDGPPATIPGSYTGVLWDGRNSEYERVRAGMYVVHLSAVDKRTGEEVTKTAPVVVATRLAK